MILVTGATGNIGRDLVPLLLEAGQQVRVFVRDERKVAHLDRRVECAVGDLSDSTTIAAASQGVKRMFLVTYDRQHDLSALDAAQRAGVQHVVKLSTLEAGNPALRVGQWHRERERLVEASGLAWTFLRPGMFMSNAIQWWADSIKQQGAVYFPGGRRGQVAPVAPYDVAAVAAAALSQPGHAGRIYELTGPDLLSIGEMVQVIARALGKPLKYVDIPLLAAKLFMRSRGLDKDLVDGLLELADEIRKNKGNQRTGTVAQITGRLPQTFAAWCRAHVAEFQ